MNEASLDERKRAPSKQAENRDEREKRGRGGRKEGRRAHVPLPFPFLVLLALCQLGAAM